jgi:hypothetical protein
MTRVTTTTMPLTRANETTRCLALGAVAGPVRSCSRSPRSAWPPCTPATHPSAGLSAPSLSVPTAGSCAPPSCFTGSWSQSA